MKRFNFPFQMWRKLSSALVEPSQSSVGGRSKEILGNKAHIDIIRAARFGSEDYQLGFRHTRPGPPRALERCGNLLPPVL